MFITQYLFTWESDKNTPYINLFKYINYSNNNNNKILYMLQITANQSVKTNWKTFYYIKNLPTTRNTDAHTLASDWI